MPPDEMSPNDPEIDSAGRKRDHDEYAGDVVQVVEDADAQTPKATSVEPASDSFMVSHHQIQSENQSSPNGLGSPAPALSETAGSTPAPNSPSPLTPTNVKPGKVVDADNAHATMSPDATLPCSSSAINQGAAAKRKRLTAVEKEAKEKELAEKKKEREEQAAKRAAEKAKQEEEKAARAKEREDKRKQKEEDDRLKAEQRDEKKRRKEEEQRRIQEEKERKARSQQKLNAFFKIPSTSKSESNKSVSDAASPVRGTKSVETVYEKLFKPFFVRENIRMAPCATQMDQETKEAKSRMLDEWLARRQDDQASKCQSFDIDDYLSLPSKPSRRGKTHHPVRHIMERASSGTGGTFDEVRKKLASIPQKIIAFSQDVRPPYYGTMTLKQFASGQGTMNQLARRPTGRLLSLDYDYDSEAEWQEEEGEDVDMDDDDDEEPDGEDNMDGFLDDTEDAGLSRRIFGHAMEPESTGICFENRHRVGPNRSVYEHRMEFVLEGLDRHNGGLDPFSTQYWEPETKAKCAKSAAAEAAAAAAPLATSSAIRPPPRAAPCSAFEALRGEAGNGTAAAAAAAKLVKAELMNEVKQAILDNKALSKVGIIDFIFHRFRDNVSRAEVKNTLELVAEKKGAGRAKEWDLKPGHEISL